MREALEALPWVRKATVDYQKKQATLTVEKGRYNLQEAVDALKKAGFGGPARELTKANEAVGQSFPQVSFHLTGMKKAKSGAT